MKGRVGREGKRGEGVKEWGVKRRVGRDDRVEWKWKEREWRVEGEGNKRDRGEGDGDKGRGEWTTRGVEGGREGRNESKSGKGGKRDGNVG